MVAVFSTNVTLTLVTASPWTASTSSCRVSVSDFSMVAFCTLPEPSGSTEVTMDMVMPTLSSHLSPTAGARFTNTVPSPAATGVGGVSTFVGGTIALAGGVTALAGVGGCCCPLS